MLKWGFEKEFFLLDEQDKAQILTDINLPCDECGWLVEARGKPFCSVVEAVFSLKAEIYSIEHQLAEINLKKGTSFRLSDAPNWKIDRKTKVAAGRRFAKPLIKYQNFYGYDSHRTSEATAGVHVSVTCTTSYTNKEGQIKQYCANFDWPSIFLKLDKEFKEEIRAARRNPGFYEIKPDGRVEYRSLPANVDLDKVIRVLGI